MNLKNILDNIVALVLFLLGIGLIVFKFAVLVKTHLLLPSIIGLLLGGTVIIIMYGINALITIYLRKHNEKTSSQLIRRSRRR